MADLSAFESDDVATDLAATFHTDGTRTVETKEEPQHEVYRNEDESDSADEIDPRKLFRTPFTYDEVRWYAYHCGEAETVIKKPIKDAFKNGWEIKDDPTNKVAEFLDDYEGIYKDCEIKARRDGMCALLWQLSDANSISESPSNVRSVEGYEILELDDMADSIPPEVVNDGTIEFDHGQIRVTDEGLVIVDDLTTHSHGDLLGYAVKTKRGQGTQFVHADRCQHFAWNKEDDGYVDERAFGQWQGNSVLLSVMIPIKSLVKARWALGQTMFRYSAPLYAIETPESYSDDQHQDVQNQLGGLNAASDVALPAGCTMDTHGVDGGLDPEPYIAALREDVCSGSIMTKSVLQGTQTGTVSGSSTDVRNYFNGVQRFREGRAKKKIREGVEMQSRFDKSAMPTFALGYELEFGPLFKLDKLDKMESMTRIVTATTNAISNYELTPNEAREVLQEQWAEIDIDVELDDLDEGDIDFLDRVNLNKMGAYEGGEKAEGEMEGNPRVGNTNEQGEGGNEQGNTTDPNDPSAA